MRQLLVGHARIEAREDVRRIGETVGDRQTCERELGADAGAAEQEDAVVRPGDLRQRGHGDLRRRQNTLGLGGDSHVPQFVDELLRCPSGIVGEK
jgi:hypothetical protein